MALETAICQPNTFHNSPHKILKNDNSIEEDLGKDIIAFL